MPDTAKVLRRLKLFRVNNAGIRIPYILEIDDDRTIVKEYPEDGSQLILPAQVTARTFKPRPETDPEVQKAVTMARWGSEGAAVNPIPGTDALRAAYFEDLKNLKASYTDETKCPPCLVGKLIRRYRVRVEEAGLL